MKVTGIMRTSLWSLLLLISTLTSCRALDEPAGPLSTAELAGNKTHDRLFQCQTKGTLGTLPSHQHVWKNTNSSATHTYVMVLGVPFSGTSATHFLLQHGNAQVSTLTSASSIGTGSKKEGFQLKVPLGAKEPKMKAGHTIDSLMNMQLRWDKELLKEKLGDPWHDIATIFLKNWDMKRKYLLESDPPIIVYYEEMIKAFREVRPDIRIAVLLITRHPCNSKTGDEFATWMYHFYRILKDENAHGGDAFLVRFEDICGSASQQHKLNKDLQSFLPGFGSLDFNASTGNSHNLPDPPLTLPAASAVGASASGYNHIARPAVGSRNRPNILNNQPTAASATKSHRRRLNRHLPLSTTAFCKRFFVSEVPYHSSHGIERPMHSFKTNDIRDKFLFERYKNRTTNEYIDILNYLGYVTGDRV